MTKKSLIGLISYTFMPLKSKDCALSAFVICILALMSCADVYDDDETWRSDVSNTELVSPDESTIVITPSTDGTSQTISWEIVNGAGGYLFTLYNVNDESNPVVITSETIDGSSVDVAREEDMNYRVEIKTLGNERLNNTGAETATVKEFTTFTETFATIPDGSDIYQWFQDNPIPEEAVSENQNFDLVANGNYTLSQSVDFSNKNITLRTNSKDLPATVVMADGASIRTSAGLVLKYISFDMTASTSAFLRLSDTPDAAILGATGSGDYYNIMNPVTINTCEINGLANTLVYDDNVKYCIQDFSLLNSIVHMSISSTAAPAAVIRFQSGFANNLTIRNSTLWNDGNGDANYFVQYNNSARCSRAGYSSNSIVYVNNTFYNIAKSGQWGNYNGFNGQSSSYWTMTGNIFVDCGNGQVARRYLGGRTASSYRSCTINNNTYWFNGAAETGNETYDTGYQLTTDPAFANPSAGDFTPTGAEQLERRTGDPRWLPEL